MSNLDKVFYSNYKIWCNLKKGSCILILKHIWEKKRMSPQSNRLKDMKIWIRRKTKKSTNGIA